MLLANCNVFNSSPGNARGGITDPVRQLKPCIMNTFYLPFSTSEDRKKSGQGEGYRPPYAWVLPFESGSLSSHNLAKISTDTSAEAQAGKVSSGTATFSISTTANGGLIVSGSGSSSITLSAGGTVIGIAAGSGSSTVTLTGSALAGAIANVSGQAEITLTPTAVISAIGYLSGISTNESEFSADALARAVWEAFLEDYQSEGTMGERMNKLLTIAKFLGLK